MKSLWRIACACVLGICCGREEPTAPEAPEQQTPVVRNSPTEARQEPAGATSQVAAIAREFRHICARLEAGQDKFYGEAAERALAGWLASPEARSADVLRREGTRIELARELLELGRTEESIRILEEMDVALLGEAPRQPPDASDANDGQESRSFSATLEDGDAAGDLRWLRLRLLRDAHLQAGEDQNCVLQHSAASCIVPFQPEALHVRPEHARRAGDYALEALESDPDEIAPRWILNLSRMLSGDYPGGVPEALRLPEDSFVSDEPFPWWHDRAPALGIDVLDLAGGAIMDDFDGDGLLDLISSTVDPCDSPKAFRNDGRGGFEDVTEAWGLRPQLGGLNLVHADYDNDGRLDLLILRGAWQKEHGEVRNSLLRNVPSEGGLRFVDVTRAAGITGAYPSQVAAWADYDGDGDLDLYVGNEGWYKRRYPSQLFRNEGDGSFTNVARSAGVANFRFAKGAAWGDVDDDGDPDLFVSNVGVNRLYRNDGDGTFSDVAAELGLDQPEGRSFASWFFDYDNDGRLDLFVADYRVTAEHVMASYMERAESMGHPLVYRNTGNGFEEVSRSLGLWRPALPMGANYGDIDGDGWLDVYLGTGNPLLGVLVPNVMLRNREGRSFADVTFAGGFGQLQKGHGVAFGDVDNDGDQDLFHQVGGFYRGDAYGNALFENPGGDARWITLQLEGRSANRFGVGARIAVTLRGPDGSRTLHRVAGSGGSFGGSSLQQEIGLGRASAIEEIRVQWPGSGSEQTFRDVEPDRVYRLVEGQTDLEVVETRPFVLGGSAPHPHPHH